MQNLPIYTIGHSNHPSPTLLEWLQACAVECLIDIRRHPGSKRLPQYNLGNLRRTLDTAAIDYQWYGKSLGGHREAIAGDSLMTALPEGPLRAFAAHMNTRPFRSALGECLGHAAATRTVLMCAERDPAHCHRWLISDYLTLNGHKVRHIVGPGETCRHTVSPSARLEKGLICYDRGMQQDLGL